MSHTLATWAAALLGALLATSATTIASVTGPSQSGQATREALLRYTLEHEARTRAVDDRMPLGPTAEFALVEAPSGFDVGKQEYESKCAACHGERGRGDGVRRPFLRSGPADLSTLSRIHGGVFPFVQVCSALDGRLEPVSNEMPRFAAVYEASVADDFVDRPSEAERFAANRIALLAEYVATLQEN